MQTQIPDGEYDLDFSSLFSSLESDVFGLRYGFKPDTIDLAFPSLLYRDFPNNSSNELNEIPCYLVAESKINKRAITTDHNKDDHIYFEGRSKTSTFQSRKPTLINTNSENNSNNSNNSMYEFLLFYDDVSKSFKVNCFDGFIKMNKSREPEKISKIITKISKNIPVTPINSQPLKESLSSSNAYVDSLIKSFAKPSLSTLKKPKSPIKIINNFSNNESTTSTKSYEKLLNGISPIRKINSNSQVNSSIKLASNISKTLSPSPSPSPIQINVSSPLKTSSASASASASPSPILKVSRSGSTSSNGGTGIRKQQKSLLLRKAERAVGINKGNNYKPKIKESIPLSELTKKKTSQLLSNANKDLELKELKIKQLERDRGRQIKEAGLEKTAFELTLTPPPSSSIVNPIKKDNDRMKGNESKETKVKEVKKVKESQSTKYSNINIPRANYVSPENQDLEILGSEMHVVDDNAVASEDDDKTIKFPPKNQLMKKEANQIKESNESKNIENLDEDFDMNFSDWEDADAIDGPVLSDDNELTAGNSDFQLIIEDDPLKTKRENEKEMEASRLKEKEDTLKFKQELKRRETELKLQQEQSKIKLKPAKNTKTPKSTTPKTSKTKKSATSPTKTAKTSSSNTKKNTKTEKTKEVDTELDKELDEELDKAFDDLLDEEDMSEEE